MNKCTNLANCPMGRNMMTKKCHVMILIKINKIFSDLPHFNRVKFAIENMAKTLFFWLLLGFVICQWSHFNAPHTNLTLVFFTSVGHLGHSF